ncbi:hypothetical protein NK8_83160 (plasmid) [Caballeronia sp. NK8]|nr:hypothetical protein NK8_67860 [Caballeronia sp. NK8]BCQ30125.1 hypothetical protein NK8_83160 [Caballeronia sp. NK8]
MSTKAGQLQNQLKLQVVVMQYAKFRTKPRDHADYARINKATRCRGNTQVPTSRIVAQAASLEVVLDVMANDETLQPFGK